MAAVSPQQMPERPQEDEDGALPWISGAQGRCTGPFPADGKIEAERQRHLFKVTHSKVVAELKCGAVTILHSKPAVQFSCPHFLPSLLHFIRRLFPH